MLGSNRTETMAIDYIEIDVSMLHTMIVREIEHSKHLMHMNIQVAMGRKPPVSHGTLHGALQVQQHILNGTSTAPTTYGAVCCDA